VSESLRRLPVHTAESPRSSLSETVSHSTASDSAVAQFVPLNSLATQERARVQAYYMMHTGNSALMQPLQSMQLVRIVDTPQGAAIPAAANQ
ncbi:MAG: hypothetical protein P8077_00750, partial [Gammaproteobacteria bacterium]